MLPLQLLNSGYNQNCKDGVLSPPTGKQINLYSARILNQSGGAVDAAICKKLGLTTWKAYTITAASTPDAVDVTALLQAGTTTTILTTTNNDGYMFGSSVPFNIIGLTVTQAQTGSPTYVYQYWNGSAYTTLTTLSVPASYAAGTSLVVFAAPQDWVPGTDVATGGSATLYNIKVTASAAGSQAVQVNAAWVCAFIEFQAALPDKAAISFDVLDSTLPLTLSGTEQVLPYFAGTANAKNLMRVLYSIQG